MKQQRVINNSAKTIAATATVVSPHVFNGQRAVIVLQNTSLVGEIISIAMIGEAVKGQGIVLNPGDKFAASKDAGYFPSNEQITAIATAATATLSIYEEIDLNGRNN